MVESFDNMDLKEELLRGIDEAGLEKPSAVQHQAILSCCAGKNVIVQAKTEDKTTALCISTLQRVNEKDKNVQALVLTSNRELAPQIMQKMKALGKYMDLKFHLSIGGSGVSHQDEQHKLEEHNDGGVQVVVGTPRRVRYVFRCGIKDSVNLLCSVKMFVLDEADRMLSNEYKVDVDAVFKCLPTGVQVLFLSTTMPSKLLELSEQFMKEPVQILDKKVEQIPENIRQFYLPVDGHHESKLEALCKLYIDLPKAVIFCNNRETIEKLAEKMWEKKFAVNFIHHKTEPEESGRALREFKAGLFKMLIINDPMAHCILDQQLSAVINYDLPGKEDYIHRCALLTTNNDKPGVVINFVTDEEEDVLEEMGTYTSTKIERMPVNIVDDVFGKLFI